MSTPYRQPVDEVLAALGTDARGGLGEEEARRRLERHGRNELAAEKPTPAWRKFLAQFQDALVVLLLVAALISAGLWLAERDSALPYEAIAILAVVLLNALMGFIQQARAEQAVAALRSMAAAKASVVRGGRRQSVPAAEVVPGDILVLEEGDTIPADARLQLQQSRARRPACSPPLLTATPRCIASSRARRCGPSRAPTRPAWKPCARPTSFCSLARCRWATSSRCLHVRRVSPCISIAYRPLLALSPGSLDPS